ncbi:hypothetical protein GGR54DRAFT_184232 [Hypoxylon sp. NC1633]|nr:hypothetical protein GGR54DRAFT_184232 [Hypoxylon sp. NC1633]
MRLFMHRHEAYVAQVFLENSKIRHWDEFKHSMDILLPAELGAEYDGRSWLLQRSPIPPSSFHRDNPDFSGWVSQESSRYLSLALRNFADPPCLLSAAAKAIQEISDIPWIDCLSTALYGPVGGSPGKSYVLASLIRQILTQQPLAFLHIRHLLPNLVNAMRGDMQAWKERCLWLCLRTLIHSPVRPAMYGFLHVETEESIEILRQIDSALDGTESRLRLVLVLAPGVVTGIRSSYFVHSDLSSNDGLSANTCNTAAKDTTLLSQSDMESLLLQKLQLSLGAVERSDFIALIWVAFATRPLYLGELETAAALDQVQRSGTTSDLDKESLGVRLRDLLPEFIEIDANRIFLRLPHRPIREVLNSSKPPGHDIGEDWSPHRYMAERCLALVKEIPKSAHDQLATSFTVYATQNWIYHYEMAGLSNTTSALEVSQGGSDIINEESTVQSWLTFVEYLSFPPSKRRKYFQPSLDISEPRLKNLLDISKTKDLKILFKLASRPSTLSGLGKLLVHAAETANNDILDKIYMEPFTPEQVEAVSRALATSHGTIHDTLMQRAASILDEDIIFRIQLEALVLGNTEVSKTLVSKLLLLPNAGERGLVTDVLIAGLEYGDESVIDDLCNWSRDAPWHHNVSLSGSKHYAGKDLTNWSILHAAAKYGNEKTVSRILGSGFLHDIRSIQGLQSPLFIAAAQGFPLIVDCLISSGALVDSPNADQQMSALHVASLLGHWATADTLLRQGADPTTSDAKGNYPLHLAIRQGHSRVAEMLVHHFPAVSELHDEANDGTSMEALDRDLGQEQTNPDDGTVPDSSTAAVNYANMYGVTALAEAADRELAGVCELILQRGGDPNIRDDAGRVALHLAAKAGSASIARDLINRGSTTDQTTGVTCPYQQLPMRVTSR